jgi:hypothetical protein
MNELQLPPAPPLPAEVRERALRTVLDGTATPRRRLAPLVAAAAVVLTLAVSTAVAITSTGTETNTADHRPADQPVSGPPARIGDDDLDEAINRCAAAVNASAHRAEYPPTAEWRVTDVLQRDGSGFWGGVTLAINGSFVCDTDPYGLRITTAGGRPAGGVQVAGLSSWQLVLFNPQRLPVEADRDDGQERTSTEPYQILSIRGGPDNGDWSSRRLVVHGSYDGPIPDPGSPLIEVRDRLGTGEPTPGQSLEDCVRAALPATRYAPPQQQEMVLRQEAREHTPRALVGRVAGSWATYCYDDPAGPVSGGNTLADAPVTDTRIVTSDRRWSTDRGPDVLIVVLMTVAPDVERVEIAARPGARPGSVAPAAPCTLQGGLALCMLRGSHPGDIRDDGAVDVLPYIGGAATPLPVP